jgi:hypothetical protein
MYKMFREICKMSQENLKEYLTQELRNTHKEIIVDDGFVYAQGTFPVLLIAHLDTVHKELPKNFEYNATLQSLSSPQGLGADDRCGVYMILETIKRYNCSVLFCEDEEIGGIGAEKFVRTKFAKNLKFNYMIEFDRKGYKDAVFYDCDNPEFEKFITSGYYETAHGSFSDISIIAPALGCAAVNLSCGYYNAHTISEFVIMPEMNQSIREACKILEKTTDKDKFEYVEKQYGRLYDDWYGYEPTGYGGTAEKKYYLIEYYDKHYNVEYDEVYAISECEAVGKFCVEHSDIPFDNVISIYDEEMV